MNDVDVFLGPKIYAKLLVDYSHILSSEVNNFILDSVLKMIDDLNSRVNEKWSLFTHSKAI